MGSGNEEDAEENRVDNHVFHSCRLLTMATMDTVRGNMTGGRHDASVGGYYIGRSRLRWPFADDMASSTTQRECKW